MTKEEKCSTFQKGRIVIHKGDDELRVYKEDLQKYYDDGWKNGFSDKRKAALKNSFKKSEKWNKHKIVIHKDNTEKIVCCEDEQKYLSDGWIRGHKEETKEKISSTLVGNTPWNKGLTKEDERVRKNAEKATQTKIERYGSAFHNNNMNDSHKQKISQSTKGIQKKPLTDEQLRIKTTKQYLTRKKNNSFNKSQKEEDFYTKLLEENKTKTIYRQYKDDRYPFYCDYYIVEDDLFIELNAHWTHGGKPFVEDDEDCQKQLSLWEEKAKTSKFYENAIQTWTVRDVEKLNRARKNHLNYKVIY